MAEEVDESVSLLTAPTWGIALTCALFVVISLAVDQVILRVGKGLAGKHKYEALFLAFEKIKNELLMVGILSLALAMGQNSFSKVCVSESWYKLKPLCKHPLSDTDVIIQEKHSTCPEGRIPFMTAESIHDLHILIFILAIVHILYSIMIIVIGMCEVHRWQAWEVSAAEKLKSEMFVDIEGNVRVTRETTFIRRRASASVWLENALIAYMVAFLKQFYTWRIKETDYVSLRNGFIKHHFPMNLDFNFHKFILRTFQDDCKRVVGIGWKLWIYAVFYLLIDVDGWETNWFATFAPLVIVLIIGAAMQHILTKMANNIKQKHAVVVGMPIVMPDDQYFGFGRPWLILGCFHFIVFQNAQGTAYAIWAAVTFPSHNCLYKTSATLVSRILIGTLVQGYCALFILPVYALISQMGMRLKKTIFSGQVNVALTKWRSSAKMRIVKTEKDGRTNKSQHTPIFVPMEESCISASAVEVDQS